MQFYRRCLQILLEKKCNTKVIQNVSTSLITICESTHTTHHAEHVVVGGIHTHLGAGGSAHGVVGHGDQQSGVVNAR